jgi:hypothetical protein
MRDLMRWDSFGKMAPRLWRTQEAPLVPAFDADEKKPKA